MGYIKSAALEETGYVVLDRYNQELDPKEWLDIEYNDWKSSGDTRFAPLASAFGEIECNGFWNHKPPRTDKDGVWIDSQTEKAPNLTRRAQAAGSCMINAPFGCRCLLGRRATCPCGSASRLLPLNRWTSGVNPGAGDRAGRRSIRGGDGLPRDFGCG